MVHTYSARANLKLYLFHSAAHLNFFRVRSIRKLNAEAPLTLPLQVHLLVFSIFPLIASAVFFASNGRNHIDFIDSAFMCFS